MKNFIILICIFFSSNSFSVMDENVCADLITTALVSNNPGTDPARIKPYWAIICAQIIATVRTATVTNTGIATVSGGSSSGVHPVASTGGIQ